MKRNDGIAGGGACFVDHSIHLWLSQTRFSSRIGSWVGIGTWQGTTRRCAIKASGEDWWQPSDQATRARARWSCFCLFSSLLSLAWSLVSSHSNLSKLLWEVKAEGMRCALFPLRPVPPTLRNFQQKPVLGVFPSCQAFRAIMVSLGLLVQAL